MSIIGAVVVRGRPGQFFGPKICYLFFGDVCMHFLYLCSDHDDYDGCDVTQYIG